MRFEQGSAKRQLVLASGAVASAESNAPEEHLARILVGMKLLDRTRLRDIATRMKDGKTADEAVLAVSSLGAADLQRGIREQAEVVLAAVLGWEDCSIRFFQGEGLLRRKQDMRIPVPALLVQAARRAASDRRTQRFTDLRKGMLVAAQNRKGDGLLNLPLDSAEAYVLSQIQNPANLDDILPLLPEGKPEQLVRCLLLLGLASLTSPDAAEKHEAAQKTEVDSTRLQLEELLTRFEVANLYQILSVPADASSEEIKQAYHGLAKRFHPDRFQAETHGEGCRDMAEKLFTYITGAYSTLGDKASRDAYDNTRLKKESKVEATLHARGATDAERDKMAETMFRAGRLSLSQCEFETAIKELKESVRLRPDVARYHHYLGLAQSEIPRLRKDAEQQLQKALELDNTMVESRLALAKLYLTVNLTRRAEAQLQQVLLWDPGNAQATELLAEIGRKD